MLLSDRPTIGSGGGVNTLKLHNFDIMSTIQTYNYNSGRTN